jgi:hypothetical protein
MKTYVTITSTRTTPHGEMESRHSFIRPSSFKKPTHDGAARIVANALNAKNDGDYPKVKPSDVSVCRVELCGYVTR